MTRTKAEKIQSLLLSWFKKHKRPLPWRMTKDPYRIWVSEIMLQQTQVKTVIPYYRRWLRHFPTLEKLARAPLSRVLKSWEGLGYYSRARNLHRTAREIVKTRSGKFPQTAQELRTLPGIGPYTAGAIASIAFDWPEPILDGNVIRVISRLEAFKEPVDQSGPRNRLWEISRRLVTKAPVGRRGDFNQSLMELGATLCLPENPKCFACPVESACQARRSGKETEFPVKSRRVRLESLRTVAAVLWKNGRVLLEKQPLEARWGGLWMFPQWIHTNGEPEVEFLKRRIRSELKVQAAGLKPRMEIRHGFTKYRVRLRVFESVGADLGVRPPGRHRGRPLHMWVRPEKLSRLPLPSPHQKIVQFIQAHA